MVNLLPARYAVRPRAGLCISGGANAPLLIEDWLPPAAIGVEVLGLECSDLLLAVETGHSPGRRHDMPSVDLAFRVRGTTLSVDHGYALYSAINRLVLLPPW